MHRQKSKLHSRPSTLLMLTVLALGGASSTFASTKTSGEKRPAAIQQAVRDALRASAIVQPLNISDPHAPGTYQIARPRTNAHFRDPRFWISLGPEAPKVIIETFRKTSGMFEKIKCLELLRFYSTASVVSFLKEEAMVTENGLLRNAAIHSVGHSQGLKERTFLENYLNHTDPHTRLAAAEELQATGNPQARLRVKQYLRNETAPWIARRLKP